MPRISAQVSPMESSKWSKKVAKDFNIFLGICNNFLFCRVDKDDEKIMGRIMKMLKSSWTLKIWFWKCCVFGGDKGGEDDKENVVVNDVVKVIEETMISSITLLSSWFKGLMQSTWMMHSFCFLHGFKDIENMVISNLGLLGGIKGGKDDK